MGGVKMGTEGDVQVAAAGGSQNIAPLDNTAHLSKPRIPTLRRNPTPPNFNELLAAMQAAEAQAAAALAAAAEQAAIEAAQAAAQIAQEEEHAIGPQK